jgi:Branched-chain amino acid transport system / permease component
LLVADAMVLGRKTYEGLAAVWPTLADDSAMGEFADRINSMPKYVASRSLSEPLAWNATLLEGDLTESVPALKERHGLLVVSGAGEPAYAPVLAGFAGVLVAARSSSGLPTLGAGLELEAIAAVVIGGTLLSGGAGSLTGTLAGVLLLGVTLSSYYQQVVSGAFLIVVVVVQTYLSRRRRL